MERYLKVVTAWVAVALAAAGCGVGPAEPEESLSTMTRQSLSTTNSLLCVTVTGSHEWCGPVPAIHRYTTSTAGTYTVALNGICGNWSGGRACQYELRRNGVKVADSAHQRWYNVRIESYTSGACAPSVQPHACGVRTDESFPLP